MTKKFTPMIGPMIGQPIPFKEARTKVYQALRLREGAAILGGSKNLASNYHQAAEMIGKAGEPLFVTANGESFGLLLNKG